MLQNLGKKTHMTFLLCVAFLFVGCDSETVESKALRDNIEKIKLNTKIVKQKTQTLQEDLKETWKNSLLYRFPNIHYISWGQEISSGFPENMDYLVSINFQSQKGNNVNIVCNYKTNKKRIRPHFYIYIFDENGINIHKEKVEYGTLFSFTDNLPLNKLISQKKKLELPKTESVPTYFLLEKIEND